ncbi:putative toxin-antitoxin system toxin component, PIN family [Methylovulum psychrotolerans]|uniref:Putative toxin-antitoxin system toxin component, PIN family n=1 Tax=Methylovulum psychrotolerans TaxID=1704499 RepID=A0A1Z4C4W3_9GAMM|nr:putative toxin-antitoxin system toxin component, PIN family [Methylovulum psychrotolerans]ASF48524.1 putative toxin-antitoxin system toxin component, PIN family [Methylovulum psychrotolerans]MBT9100566.1 putative toxin-antitoxin system toxin component, PIN family [Methylovulum psychrotolerans]POZ49692.1 putative toxin-antitoxin system toxin component, PIN family [Methylovulum psychrotolerans]
MLVVLDTNIIISAMLLPNSQPAKVIARWREGKFKLLTSAPQVDELMRVTRYPKVRDRLNSVLTGRLINEMRDIAVMVDDLPQVDVSPDPYDNYLLATASGGLADYLVTGDKLHLLILKKFDGIPIVSVADFLARTRWT